MKQISLTFASCLLSFFGSSQNLLTNGGFESGFTGWNNLAGGGGAATYSLSTTDKQEGTQSMKAVITTAGTNPWDVQSIGPTWTATLNKTYTISLYAKSSVANATLNIVQQNTGYSSKAISLTTAWAKYEYQYTAGETSPIFKLQFPATGTYFIDGISITNYVPPVAKTTDSATVTPATQYQTMVGFGGALTWFCPRVVKSAKKTEITNLLFTDLGADIIRFKNWYYPTNYPTDKTTNNIEGGVYWQEHLTASTELHTLAKQANANVQTLLCSWTPPPYLKSNGKQEEGTLKKNGAGLFMYDELGTYWNDVLDNVGFNPDYISMQNEPGYVNSGWGTCEWRPTETSTLPGYDKGFDAVYNKIKGRTNIPKMIGPEVENIGSTSWNASLNLFREFATPVKAKSYLSAYAFHPYNFAGSPDNLDKTLLNILKNEFNDKPNFMTEFSNSNFNWLKTAGAIQTMLTEANVSAYIYWEMMWAPASDAMIEVDDAGNYTVKPHYYAIKHFSKYIDKDYKRIAVTNKNTNIQTTGFINPTGNKITLVMVNNGAVAVNASSLLTGYSITASQVYQSDGVNFFQNKGSLNSNGVVSLADSSITTIVLDVKSTITALENETSNSSIRCAPNPFQDSFTIDCKDAFRYSISDLNGKILSTGSSEHSVEVGKELQAGIYVIYISNNNIHQTFKMVKK